jgi:hypothetical protein
MEPKVEVVNHNTYELVIDLPNMTELALFNEDLETVDQYNARIGD